MYIFDHLKEKEYDFPSQDIDPSLKQENKYQLEVSQAIYANNIRGNSAFPLDMEMDDCKTRAYLIGKMNIEQFKSRGDGEKGENKGFDNYQIIDRNLGTKKDDKKGWRDIKWHPLNAMAKIHNSVQGQLENVEFDIIANAVDQLSIDEKEYNKIRLLVESRNKIWIEQMTAQMGTSYAFPDFLPDNLDELELHELSGGFKLSEEIQLEELLKHTIDISDWKSMKISYIADLLSIGRIAVRAYYDDYTNKIKWKYTDPISGKLAIQYVKEGEFDDAQWVAIVNIKTLGEVNDALALEGYPLEQRNDILLSVCKQYSNIMGNPNYDEYMQREVNVANSWIWSGWKVEVQESYWIDTDTEKQLFNNFPSYGTPRVYDLNYDETFKETGKPVKRNKNATIKEIPFKQSYHTYWIIGSETTYDGGFTKDVVWINDKPQLPVKIIRLRNESATKLAMPWIDALENAWFNYQNTRAQIWGDIMAFDIGAISNIKLGDGISLSEMDIIQMAREKNVLVYRKTDAANNITTQQIPIGHVSGTAKENLDIAMAAIDYAASKIEYFTGYNPLSTGGQPDERAGKGTSEIAINATANLTKPLVNAIFDLKGKMADYSAFAICHLIKTNSKAREAYENAIGKRGVEIIQSSVKSHRQMSITLEARPTDDIKQELKGYIQQSLAGGKNGNSIIDTDDAMKMTSMINNGVPIKKVWSYISYEVKKKRKEKEKAASDANNQNHQQNTQLQQQKEQAEKNMALMLHQMKIDEFKQETKGKLLVEFGKANPSAIPTLIPDLKDALKEDFPMPWQQPQQQQNNGQPQQNQQVGKGEQGQQTIPQT